MAKSFIQNFYENNNRYDPEISALKDEQGLI